MVKKIMRNGARAMMASVSPLLWASYRHGRGLFFTLLRRNPLASGRCGVPYSKDLEVARILTDIHRTPPALLEKNADGLGLWRTSLGDLWAPPGAEAHFIKLIEVEARSDVYLLKECPLQGATLLDCGSNIGIMSKLALRLGVARIVCFEPSPRTAECLRRNLAPEIERGVVTVLEKALWNKEDRLFLNTARIENPASHSLISQGSSEHGVWVPVTTIDNAVRELGLSSVDFIKMDIEGAELRALEGAAETIRKFRPYLGLGTEHTKDLYANNMAVVRLIRSFDSSYQYVCTEVHPHQSPSMGMVLAPHSMFFYPSTRPFASNTWNTAARA